MQLGQLANRDLRVRRLYHSRVSCLNLLAVACDSGRENSAYDMYDSWVRARTEFMIPIPCREKERMICELGMVLKISVSIIEEKFLSRDNFSS